MLCFPDTVPIEDGTGDGLRGVLQHSLSSQLLVPDFSTAAPADAAVRIVRCFAYRSDAGPDQMKARRDYRDITSLLDTTFFFDDDCLAHQTHLGAKGGLCHVDALLSELGKPYKYFGTVAKTMNLWRMNARQIWKLWVSQYGPTDAKLQASRIPPRCIAERWGSISACELYLLNAGRDRILEVFTSVLGKRVAAKTRAQTPGATSDPSLEVAERAAFSAKLGRWAREAFSAQPAYCISRRWAVMRLPAESRRWCR
jgi:hypothetical protein